MKRSRKYVLDTQLFIQAFRNPPANNALQHFHQLFAPFEYFSAVVAQELRAGARTSRDRRALEIARVSKAFGNDILLALSCREAGCVLITDNVRDFARIRRFVRFDFIPPWPG